MKHIIGDQFFGRHCTPINENILEYAIGILFNLLDFFQIIFNTN